MKVTYEITMKVKGVFEVDNLLDVKSNTEFADNLGQFFCDEITSAEGVGEYDVLDSCLHIKF